MRPSPQKSGYNMISLHVCGFTPPLHPETLDQHSPNAGLMLCQRLRRWANIKIALGQGQVLHRVGMKNIFCCSFMFVIKTIVK